ncbi:putative nuclease HARBI1 [Tanacetum coccineum]
MKLHIVFLEICLKILKYQAEEYEKKLQNGKPYKIYTDVAWLSVSSHHKPWKTNQRKTSMWARICQMYDQIRAENPKDIGPQNENQMKGSCNDINVLHRSPIFSDVLEGRAPKVSYVMNGHQRNMAYYLTDGIYPSWAAFVKSITSLQIRKHKLFAQHQEVVQKDVERAFGVLQARFAFLRLEDERETYKNSDQSEFFNDMDTNDDDVVTYSTERIADLASFMRNREQLRTHP